MNILNKNVILIILLFTTLNVYNTYKSFKILGVSEIKKIDVRNRSNQGPILTTQNENGYNIRLTSTKGERSINLNLNANNDRQIEKGTLYKTDNYTDKTVHIDFDTPWYENWYIYSINVGIIHENEVTITLFKHTPLVDSTMIVINLGKRPKN
ncbi:MAG: hypothetical protein ACI9TY_001482 [Alphaproteobacteria bacterium]|jgi:hypothetical protein